MQRVDAYVRRLLLALASVALASGGAVAQASTKMSPPMLIPEPMKALHGATMVMIPNPFLQVVVDAKTGTATPAGGGTVQALHQEGGLTCTKVAFLHAAMLNGSPDFKRDQAMVQNINLCNFGVDTGQLPIQWDWYWWASNRFVPVCTADRAKTGWSGLVPLGKVRIELVYKGDGVMNGDEDMLERDVQAMVACPPVPCTALDLKQYGNSAYTPLPEAPLNGSYSTRLFSGGTIPVRVFSSPPPGLTLGSDGQLTGSPVSPGSYRMDFSVKDFCPWDSATKRGTASLVVRDMVAPKLVSFDVTPDTLPSNGGDMTLRVHAMDNYAVFRVQLTYTKPDGSHSGMQVPMISGTPKDGVWQAKWSVGSNSGANPAVYSISLVISDGDGNSINVPAKTFVVSGHPTGKDLMQKPVKP